MKEQDERERLKPEIKKYQEKIDEMHNSIALSKVAIEKETQSNGELNEMITKYEGEKEV
jgi:uncharacterized protein YlxW (UPF0749 family)